jgi:segregation and condensation protein B
VSLPADSPLADTLMADSPVDDSPVDDNLVDASPVDASPVDASPAIETPLDTVSDAVPDADAVAEAESDSGADSGPDTVSDSARSEMEAALEAILFVSSEPVPRERLLELFGKREQEAAAAALEAVLDRYRPANDQEQSGAGAGRGVMVDEVAGGVRLVTRPELGEWLRRFFEVRGNTKLSMAALETLAIVAYRQPTTAPEIQELRGVNSSGVLKTLLERRLIRIAGRKEVVGNPFLYRTTKEFLVHFGLGRLKELPPLEEFEEIFGLAAEADGPEGGVLASEVGLDREEEILKEAAQLDDASDGGESDGGEMGDGTLEEAG